MACHRLALWCWLQQEGIFSSDYSLIHIDRHIDARRWEAVGEQEIIPDILAQFKDLKDFERFESFTCPLRDVWNGRKIRPAITYDNFVHLAAEARLFKHYYLYASEGDWHTSLEDNQFSHFKQTRDIYQLEDAIKSSEGKCIIDIDLDFFDNIKDFIKRGTDDGILSCVLNIIARHRDKISMITLAINDVLGDELWEKRMVQMKIVKHILGLEVELPVIR